MTEIMRHCRNDFSDEEITGTWRVTGGAFTPALPGNTWVRLVGRGVWQTDAAGCIAAAADGEWTGTVRILKIPQDFLTLCEDIARWCGRNPESDRRQETAGSAAVTYFRGGWASAFAERLRPFRKMFGEKE